MEQKVTTSVPAAKIRLAIRSSLIESATHDSVEDLANALVDKIIEYSSNPFIQNAILQSIVSRLITVRRGEVEAIKEEEAEYMSMLGEARQALAKEAEMFAGSIEELANIVKAELTK